MGFFGRMEVRLFLAINHSDPLTTKVSLKGGQEKEWEVSHLDTPKAQTSVNVQVKEFWMSGTECSSPWMQNPKKIYGKIQKY